MSDTNQTGGVVPPKKRRVPAILPLLGIFLAGMLCGAGLGAQYVMHRLRDGVRNPEHRIDHMLRGMSKMLELTPEQEKRARAILDAQEKDLMAIRKAGWPKVTARLERTDREIGDLLDAGQLKKWRELSEGMHRHWMPAVPGGMRPQPSGRPDEKGAPSYSRPGNEKTAPARGRPANVPPPSPSGPAAEPRPEHPAAP